MGNLFNNPWILAAILAVGIPPLIEWLFRRRRRQITLPSIRYLLKSRDQQKIKKQDRLLLLLRMIGVALLVLGVARPVIQHGLVGATRTRHVVIVLDATASMSQQVGVTTSFGLAQKKAAGMVRGLPEGTRVTVAEVGERVRVIVDDETDLFTVADRIGGLRNGSGAAPMKDALQWLDGYLKDRAVDAEPEIYLFSDFQKYTWTRQDAQESAAALRTLTDQHETYLVDVGGDAGYNFMVTALRPRDFVLASALPVEFVATVETTGAPPADADLTATFLVNGEKKGVRSLAVSPDPQTLSFTHQFVQPGEYLVEVLLEGDEHFADNRRLYLCTVPESVQVLALDETHDSPTADTRFLARAIAPPQNALLGKLSPFAIKVAHPNQIAYENLESYGLVVLAGSEALTEPMVRKLENYVRTGGALWLFMGPSVNLYTYNKLLFNEGKGLLPAKLKDKVNATSGNGQGGSAPVFLKPGAEAHPALQAMDSDAAADGVFLKYVSFDLPVETGTGVDLVALLSDNAPAFVERSFGRGKVLACCSTAGVAWNYLPATGEYPVMVQEMLRHLVGNADARVNLDVGERFESPVYISDSQLLLVYPDGSKAPRITPAKIEGRDDAWTMSFDATHMVGMYRIDAPEEVVPRRRFVVNPPGEEGDLARLRQSDFAGAFGSGWSWIGPEKPIEDFVANLHTVTELSPFVLWGLVIVLTAESFLAAQYGRRRGVVGSTTGGHGA